MAFTIDTPLQQPLALEDYVEHIRRHVDVREQSSIIDSSSFLLGLASDKDLLTAQMINNLKSSASAEVVLSPYIDSTFVLWSEPHSEFFVRANVWRPTRTINGSTAYDDRAYSYHLAHDHNFDFLTVGYWGNGYSTKIYEYERGRELLLNEGVDILFLEETKLPRGKVMFYRKSEDIHLQMPPEDLSISINLMITTPESFNTPQYSFNIDSSTVASRIRGHIDDQISLIELAVDFLGENAIEPIETILAKTPNKETRDVAKKALFAMAPEHINRWERYC